MTDSDLLDVIVTGAGPAGLATALYAARAGLRTLVLDARESPIDKACGEGLMPGAVRHLRRLGVTVEGREFHGIRYTDGRRAAEARFRHGPGLGVRRTHLQGALVARARAAGVQVVHERAADVRVGADDVRVGGHRGRYLVVADGLHSPVSRRLGLTVPRPQRRDRQRWGMRQHFAVEPWTDLVEVHWARAGEAYVTPVGPELVGVAVLSGERRPFPDQLAAFPELSRRLPPAGVTAVRGAGPLRRRTVRRVAGRALLVGDAAGYVDALTGEGVTVALDSARALVDCLADDDPARYERLWWTASRRYRWITTSLLWARHQPGLGPGVVPLAARFPQVFGAVVRQLAR